MSFSIVADRMRAVRRVIGVSGLTVLWLGLIGLSSSAQLHQLVHADAQGPTHECVLTSIAKGELLLLAPGVLVSQLPFFESGLGAESRPVVDGQLDLRLAFGRAPPPRSMLPN